MEPWGRWGASLAPFGHRVGARSVPEPSAREKTGLLGRLFRNLEGFLTDLGPSWGRQGPPKAPFGGKNHSKNKKNEVQEPFQKKHQKMMENRCRKWRFWEGKVIEILRTVTKIQGFGVLHKDQKMIPKRPPKEYRRWSIPGHVWRFEPISVRFLAFWREAKKS